MNTKDATLRLLDTCITRGHLDLVDGSNTYSFGEDHSDQNGRMYIDNQVTYSHFLRGSLGFGESYMAGYWHGENDDIVHPLGVLIMNDPSSALRGELWQSFCILLQRLYTNPRVVFCSRRNVQHHYDISNHFYAYMLDASMTYSCGFLEGNKQASLEEMQHNKYAVIARKLDLRPHERMIDIGCGWGGCMEYMLHHHGANSTGVTLSKNQYAWIREHMPYLDVRLLDYRKIPPSEHGTFDKFVSIGMYEHVGKNQYARFARKTYALLKNEGLGLLHTIGIKSDPRGGLDPWLSKYIFPGGRLPQLCDITSSLSEAGLTVHHVDDHAIDYAETLRRWRNNFDSNREEIAATHPHLDSRFFRMWDYYLQGCEAFFRSNSNARLYQVLFSKGRHADDIPFLAEQNHSSISFSPRS